MKLWTRYYLVAKHQLLFPLFASYVTGNALGTQMAKINSSDSSLLKISHDTYTLRKEIGKQTYFYT